MTQAARQDILSKSFMNIKNSNGPRTDPCGTPLKTDAHWELCPSRQTLCILSLSHELIHFNTCPSRLYHVHEA